MENSFTKISDLGNIFKKNDKKFPKEQKTISLENISKININYDDIGNTKEEKIPIPKKNLFNNTIAPIMKEKCNCAFESDTGYLIYSESNDKKVISISNYLSDTKIKSDIKSGKCRIVCKKGFDLIGYDMSSQNKKSHFKHEPIKLNDIDNLWHKSWQELFDNTEVKIGSRRADIVIDKIVLELQHSEISQNEVNNRINDYKSSGYVCHWLVDGNNGINVVSYGNIHYITFINGHWRYESYIDCNFIFVEHNKLIYKLKPSKVKGNMTVIIESFTKDDFIKYLEINNKMLIDDAKHLDETIYLNQLGAGCGKTYESIQLIQKDTRFSEKDKFIYLTKLNSAKHVILTELESQVKRGDLTCIDKSDLENIAKGKQYKLDYFDQKYKRNRQILIGTVDSFTYALGDKNVNGNDYFLDIVKSIKTKKYDYDLKYKKMTLDKKCLIIIDEAQDLGPEYIEALNNIIKTTGIDLYIIGDKLQSIMQEPNIYTFLSSDANYLDVNIVKNNGVNHIKRFHNEKLMDFVNGIVQFEKFGLPKIDKICDKKDCGHTHNTSIPYNVKMDNRRIYDFNEENCPQYADYFADIIKKVDKEVNENNYLPKNFMFIFPFVATNKFATYLQAELQQYWIKKFDEKEYYEKVVAKDNYWSNIGINEYNKYVFYHKSENGTPINLGESENATRILSIHASKGNGCEVVFLIGMSESGLKKFGDSRLKYESLLHVALTRQKKSIYVYLENGNDDIYQRLKKNVPIESDDSIFSANMITKRTAKIIPEIYSNTTYFDKIKNDIIDVSELRNKIIFDDRKNNGDMIDWGHHLIRTCILKYNILGNIFNDDNFDKDEKFNSEFYNCVRGIPKKQIRRLDNKKYWDSLYEMMKNRIQKRYKLNDVIPLLIFTTKSNCNYNKYSDILEEMIIHIQKKISDTYPKIPLLCPVETVIFWHIVQLFNNGKYAEISIMDVYSLMSSYDDCNHTLDDSHTKQNNCLCKKLFIKSDKLINQKTKQINYSIKEHYEKINKIKEIFAKYKIILEENTIRDLKYNIEKSLFHFKKCDDFALISKESIIAYNDNYLIRFLIKPQINKINLNEILFDIIFGNYFLEHPSNNDNYTKFSGKKIITCLITFDLDNVYFFDTNTAEQNEIIKNVYSEYMENTYNCYHKNLFDIYTKICLSHSKSKEKGTTLSKMIKYLNEYENDNGQNNNDKTPKIPPYMKEYYQKVENEIKDMDKSDPLYTINRTKILKKVNDKEIFLENIMKDFNLKFKNFIGGNDENEDSDEDY